MSNRSIGNGTSEYTQKTSREYLRRVMREITFHESAMDRLVKLASRYQKKLSRHHNPF